MNGNAVYGERVVIVEVRRGHINLKTGRISSTGSSHPQADNQSQTVVWADRHRHPVADDPAEACEKSFAVDDIHLLKEQEARSLLDRGTAQSWFGSIYQDRLVTRIHHALKRLKRE
jgi:hypothetical protein